LSNRWVSVCLAQTGVHQSLGSTDADFFARFRISKESVTCGDVTEATSIFTVYECNPVSPLVIHCIATSGDSLCVYVFARCVGYPLVQNIIRHSLCRTGVLMSDTVMINRGTPMSQLERIRNSLLSALRESEGRRKEQSREAGRPAKRGRAGMKAGL